MYNNLNFFVMNKKIQILRACSLLSLAFLEMLVVTSSRASASESLKRR